MDYDVVVIGAGPSGSTAASDLALAGWKVGVLEKKGELGAPINCSGVIGIEAFRRYILPRDLIRFTIRTLDFHSPGGLRWRFVAGRPLAHVVDRSELDRFLGRRAQSAGAEILLGHRVTDIERARDGAVIRARTSDGTDRTLRARAVVVATGAGASLLQRLDCGSPPKTLTGAQTEVLLGAASVEVHLGRRWAPEGFAWVIPLGGGTAKVGLLCHGNGRRYLRRFLEREDIRVRLRSEPRTTRCSVLPLGFTPRSYGDRLIVVGEAAGHIKPITCGGIYYGMLTGRIAAEVLEEALEKDRLEGGFLSVYEERWRSLLEEESRAGMMLRQTFRFTPDSVLDRMISLAGKHGIEKLIRDNADFDWHRNLIREVFRHSPLGNLLGSLTSPGKDPLILNSTEALT